jgi:proline iminopeptidase
MMLLAIAFAVTLFATLVWSRPAFTAPIKDASGKTVPGSIAYLERFMLGSVEQGMLIRGIDVENPVLCSTVT